VSEFLFGSGFAIAGGDLWRVRRKAVGPALHRAYLQTMIDRVFGPSAEQLCSKLQVRRQIACRAGASRLQTPRACPHAHATCLCA